MGYNSIAGPLGSQVMGSTEEALKGLVTGDSSRTEVGLAGLKAANPLKWVADWKRMIPEAEVKIHDVEEVGRAGQFTDPANKTAMDMVMERPAVYMLAGDLNAKQKLADAGFSEGLTRAVTLTDEPERAVTKLLANFGKSESNIAKGMLPFVRTAANITESGAERTLLLGTILNLWGDESLRIPMKEQLVQEGLGAMVWGLGYAAGNMVDDDTARSLKIQSLVSNLGGQYSLLANAGFIAGQSRQRGKDFLPAAVSGTRQALLDMPLPSTDPIKQTLFDPVEKVLSGEPLTKEDIPGVAVPGIFKAGQELQDWLTPQATRTARPQRQSRYRPVRPREQ
jgi:hypothetical protein